MNTTLISDRALAGFWAKVRKTDTCWLWFGDRKDTGYGRYKFGRKNVAAHRFTYELAKGPIPEGLEIDHLCRVRNCVNPDHLEAVTHLVNVRRSERVAGCPPTHVKDTVTRPSWNGKYALICRTCKKEYDRIRWANRNR